MNDNIFVGFGTAQAWLSSIDPERPVNMGCPRRVEIGKMGIGLVTTELVLSQFKDGEVLYLLRVVDRYQSFDGEAVDRDDEKHSRRQESALEAARAWAKPLGLQLREAVVNVPKDIRLMEGEMEFLQFDKSLDKYIYREVDNGTHD